MLKYKSRKDFFTVSLYILGMLLSLGAIGGGLILSASNNDATTKIFAFMLVGIAGATLAALVCNAVRTEYTLYDDVLEITGGFGRNHITYKQIYALQRTKKIFCFNALAREKFEVIYRNSEKRIYISPENEAVFIKELKKHCKNLQIRDYE